MCGPSCLPNSSAFQANAVRALSQSGSVVRQHPGPVAAGPAPYLQKPRMLPLPQALEEDALDSLKEVEGNRKLVD